jgi:hypothetical protein
LATSPTRPAATPTWARAQGQLVRLYLSMLRSSYHCCSATLSHAIFFNSLCSPVHFCLPAFAVYANLTSGAKTIRHPALRFARSLRDRERLAAEPILAERLAVIVSHRARLAALAAGDAADAGRALRALVAGAAPPTSYAGAQQHQQL